MPSIAHSKTSSSLELTSTENTNYYVRTKYTSKLAENISEPSRVRVLNMTFDAKKYTATDLIDYANLVCQDKWVNGSEYNPATQQMDAYRVNISLQFDVTYKSQSFLMISTNYAEQPDLSVVGEPADFLDTVRFDTKLVRFAPGVIQYRSVLKPEYIEAFKNLNHIRITCQCYGTDKTSYYPMEYTDVYSDGLTSNIMDLVSAPHSTHAVLATIDTSGVVDWMFVASKDTF